MTQPYLFISFTALLLTPGTRKRPPQSGSVQTLVLYRMRPTVSVQVGSVLRGASDTAV